MLTIESCKYNLKFRFNAGTSRGVLKEKDSWFIILHDSLSGTTGIGECSPLPGLSVDYSAGFENNLKSIIRDFSNLIRSGQADLALLESVPDQYPSIKMGMETAWFDFVNGGQRKIFDNAFFRGEVKLPINGLIWMGSMDYMAEQINKKIEEGYTCLKLKIGAINFDSEFQLLKNIRQQFSKNDLTIRVDANGGFSPEEVNDKLDKLGILDIHSIEQPVLPDYTDLLATLSRNSPVPVALDESLIGVSGLQKKAELLEFIRPQYIVLKPTLIGGFASAREWISVAEKAGIGWWITSALESNIGLNAISQFTAEFTIDKDQGLGTGQLFHNNITSPLVIERGKILYDRTLKWDLKKIIE